MSLINDALKKAQNRQGDSNPIMPRADGPAAIPSQPGRGKASLSTTLLVGGGIGLLCIAVSVTVTFFLLRKDDPAPAIAPAPPATIVVQPTPASVTPVANTPAPITPPPVAASPVVVSPPATTPSSAAPVAPAEAVVVPVAPPEPAPVIKLGTRIQSFVDRLRVTSIRISDTGNKAILNDRLFRVNDLVEPTLGLRLTDIQPKVLTFTDETGATYLRHF
jgi:hypothetical protein